MEVYYEKDGVLYYQNKSIPVNSGNRDYRQVLKAVEASEAVIQPLPEE